MQALMAEWNQVEEDNPTIDRRSPLVQLERSDSLYPPKNVIVNKEVKILILENH